MFEAYLFTRLDVLLKVAEFTMVGSFITLFVLGFFILMLSPSSEVFDDEKEARESMKGLVKPCLWVLIVSTILCCLVPNTKQAAFIWIAPQIVENGAVKETAANIPELAKLGTDYLKEVLKQKIDEQGSK